VFPKGVWWARVAVTGGYGFLIAGNLALDEWKSFVSPHEETTEFAEYEDNASGVYRAAVYRGGRLSVCLFIEPSRDVPDWESVKAIFAADTVTEDQRRLLLSGKPADGLGGGGPVVCACFGVGRTTICNAIASGAACSAADIGAQLKAGTNCGSCIPELKRLIAQTPVEGAGSSSLARPAASAAN